MPISRDAMRQLADMAAEASVAPEPEPESDDPFDEYDDDAPPNYPPAGPPQPWRLLTIGMATYDDFDGAWFSIQALRMYHPEVLDEVSFLLVDNNPGGRAAGELKLLEAKAPNLRYLPAEQIRGTAVRDLVFREANSDWVLCIDSHVLLEPGSIRALLDYCRANPDSKDLLHGPLTWDELGGLVTTHMDPVWRAGMFGTWSDARSDLALDDEPFEIPQHGLGAFACRKAVWPGFNPRFSGFGGEEGYLHQKFRNQGGRVLCLPFLRWLHRFVRPLGTPYRNVWEDRIRNYLIGWEEVGLDPDDVIDHFSELLGAETTRRVVDELAIERRNPFWRFDGIYCINLDRQTVRWEAMQRQFEYLGIAHRVRRFSAIETPENHHIGCTLSHGAILAEARAQGLETVLILEDDVRFLEGTVWALHDSLTELDTLEWNALYLGGHKWGEGSKYARPDGCEALEIPHGLSCAHAVLYHERSYDTLLADLPAGVDDFPEWRERYRAYDQYLMQVFDDGVYVTRPVLATQRSIFDQEDPQYRDHFVE